MNNSLSLYSTMERKILPFVPIDDKRVKIYSCGPTVYGVQHIGNMRYVFYVDFLKTVLREISGYQVEHVMNITDVGHLTDDGDEGEDKMEKGARRDGTSVREIAKKYTDIFLQDIRFLDCNHFDAMPRATEYIKEQIDMIQDLVRKGLTYTIPGDGIYCDTSTVKDYGKLLPEGHLSGLQEGARVDHGSKRNPTDFALRKFSPTSEKRAMERVYEGKYTGQLFSSVIEGALSEQERATVGFPGRHIECSAMSYSLLGKQIDIHTGGIEHIPVHHTNEIVQSECSFCATPRVGYRFHLQHLQIDGTKISKSIGNVVFVSDIQEKGFSAGDIRYFFLSAHYRNFQDFTREQLTASRATRHNLIRKLTECERDHLNTPARETGELYDAVRAALLDDLDTVTALRLINTADYKEARNIQDLLMLDETIFRLGLRKDALQLLKLQSSIPEEIKLLAGQRLEAKTQKNYVLADELREKIKNLGREVRDEGKAYQLYKSLS